MTEQEIEELLGAYALDAVDDSERQEIEAHLSTCPRCRSEVSAHREVASLLANTGSAAPEGLWNRISDELSTEPPVFALNRKTLASVKNARQRRNRRFVVPAAIGAAAIAVAIALLSLQIANLDQQVHRGGTSSGGIAAAVGNALSHQHREVVLTSANRALSATVAISPDGNAYWIGSNMKTLSRGQTYQLWTLVRGKRIVSLGVLGSNPTSYSMFHVQPDMGRLMVTVEPEGGTPAPTNPVLVSAVI